MSSAGVSISADPAARGGAVSDAAGLRALALANARYWPTVAPRVSAQLAHWRARASEIPDPARRELALEKLTRERFNVLLAATLATLAPRSLRAHAVAAIVATQVAYDYLDALTERPSRDPLGEGRRAYAPFEAMFAQEAWAVTRADEYVRELALTVAGVLSRLPSTSAIAPTAQVAAARCAEAQTLAHAAPAIGLAPVERWVRELAARVDGADAGAGRLRGSTAPHLRWPELLAGAQASVLSLHALIATAARAGASEAQARAIDEAYVTIGALSMLDGLIDRESDLLTTTSGAISYPALYADSASMGRRLAALAREGLRQVAELPDAAHHAVTLTGVVAYYAADPRARQEPAREVFAAVTGELGGLLEPALALMRVWRLAHQGRGIAQARRGSPGNAHGESAQESARASARESAPDVTAGC